tara:strand:- start:2979 stop:3209 length:231 start_codon:yes stop_codon:yes gene_type:complete
MVEKYKPFGVNLDPKGELSEKNLPDGDIRAKIKGETVNYDEMINELEERATNSKKGKPISTKKYFGGWIPPNKRKE